MQVKKYRCHFGPWTDPVFFTDATEKLITNKVANKKAYNIKALKFKKFTASHQNIHTNKKRDQWSNLIFSM